MNKTCLQCGAILPSGISACRFCDSQFQPRGETERASVLPRHDVELTSQAALRTTEATSVSPEDPAVSAAEPDHAYEWRSELANRVEAYRVRRRKVSPNAAQAQLPFTEPVAAKRAAAVAANYATTVPVAELHRPEIPELQSISSEASCGSDFVSSSVYGDDDFAFTIAIGRIASKPHTADGRMMIDVSNSADADPEASQGETEELTENAQAGLYPVAPLGDRQLAGIIDAVCLLFAFGGFVALFGSLGGQLTLGKMNAAVYLTALSVVYFQYFALFTIFGATTPGMMFRGLQVMSFSGEPPTPRQLLLRSAGYMLSAGTCLIGFLWALWDEDQLTWHDRMSKTYLSSAQTYAEVEPHSAAHR
ncbi:MAG: hypothetical protein QOG55_417 [Acidobacteriaceae bacterium]|nr:hypothetical protein [Acidobacteriaceae bacterium]